jgi:hypothetical protein
MIRFRKPKLALLLCALASVQSARSGPLSTLLEERLGAEHAAAIQATVQDALWDHTRTAVAVSVPTASATRIFVVLRPNSVAPVLVDISHVENVNIGKLGSGTRSAYDRVASRPTRWMPREDELLQLEVTTQAWKRGTRYSSREPLVLRQDGTVLWR